MLIYQDSQLRLPWDIIVTVLLVFVCVVTPLHIAFNYVTYWWCMSYYLIDFLFMIDIIVIFFTTLSETDEQPEITDRKQIAISYLKGWFFVDLMAIFPFDLMAKSFMNPQFEGLCYIRPQHEQSLADSQASLLLRAPKIQKIFRGIRLLRMIKLIKLMKNKEEL